MSAQSEQKQPRMRLWLRVLLGASLALNLLTAGLVAGAVIRFGGPHRMHPRLPVGAMLFRELPREDRRALRQRAFGSRQDREARRRADAEEIDAALRASPFEAARLDAFLRRQAQQHDEHEQAVHQAWLARIKAMSDGERAAYADRLRQAMQAQANGRHLPHRDRD